MYTCGHVDNSEGMYDPPILNPGGTVYVLSAINFFAVFTYVGAIMCIF